MQTQHHIDEDVRETCDLLKYMSFAETWKFHRDPNQRWLWHMPPSTREPEDAQGFEGIIIEVPGSEGLLRQPPFNVKGVETEYHILDPYITTAPITPDDDPVGTAWDILGKRIEWCARALGIFSEGDSIRSGRGRGDDARDRILDYLQGACGVIVANHYALTIGDVLDHLSRACRAVGVSLPDDAAEAAQQTAEEWSAPMSKDEIARRVTGNPSSRFREVQPFIGEYGLRQVSERKWQVRLDRMDQHNREKLEGSGPQ